MLVQPFDRRSRRLLSDGRGWRVVHVLEDCVKHRACIFHQPLEVLVGLAVDVRQEDELLVPLRP